MSGEHATVQPAASGALKIMALMKTDLACLAFVGALLCLGCSSHASGNPASLGEANFDLMEMEFSERVDVLLGKANHYRSAIQDGASVIAYNFIASKKQHHNIRVSLGRLDASPYRYEFKADPAGNLIGVSVSFVTSQDLRAQIIENIERREKQNRVAVGSLQGYPVVHRWESKDKVVQFAFATVDKDNVYNVSIVGTKYDCGNFPLERLFIGEDICLKKYPRN
jgi:hypothetical protein